MLTLVVGLVCSTLKVSTEIVGPVAGLSATMPGVIGYQVWASRRRKAGQSTKNARPIGYILAIALGGLIIVDTVLGAIAGAIISVVDPVTGQLIGILVIVVMLAIVFLVSMRIARSLGPRAVLWTIGIIVVAFIVRCIILFVFMASYITSLVGPGWEVPALGQLLFSWTLVVIVGALGSLIGWYRAKRLAPAAPVEAVPATGLSGPPPPPDPLDRRLD